MFLATGNTIINKGKMRKTFFEELYKQMTIDKDIVALTADLGYIGFDRIRDNYPTRFFNCGASEQAMMDMAVGMALSGKKPFVYSITNFLLYRPFETLRNYVHYEEIPVRLVASGRDYDYEHDGISHWSPDARVVLDALPNIIQYWPKDTRAVTRFVKKMVQINEPQFISLTR